MYSQPDKSVWAVNKLKKLGFFVGLFSVINDLFTKSLTLRKRALINKLRIYNKMVPIFFCYGNGKPLKEHLISSNSSRSEDQILYCLSVTIVTN